MPDHVHAESPMMASQAVLLADAIEAARTELRAALVELSRRASAPAFDPIEIEGQLFRPLAERLERMCSRTLALELHIADLQGLLPGDDPRSRYLGFLTRLRDPAIAAALLDEYAVLRDQTRGVLERWVEVSRALLRHLVEDAHVLAQTFGPLGALATVTTGAGDPHRGGRSVAILEFEGGRKLVYKPRSLAVDVHVQGLLAWLNARGDHPPFRRLAVVDCRDHGWVEWIAARPAASAAETHAYYQRLGGLAAVAYVVGAIDLHHENLIAEGEHPILLDVETLFHPDLLALDDTIAHERAWRVLADSAVGSGMLPQRVLDQAGKLGPDVSGIGVDGEQAMPYLVPRWVDAGTSRMRLTRAPAQLRGAHNRAKLDGAATDPVVFADDIVAGFDAVYRCMAAHRDELASPTGPIAAFADDEIRVLLRPTRAYFRLLDESFHPDVLRDTADRERLFERLREVDSPIQIPPGAFEAECRELWRADIPLFTSTPASRHLECDGSRLVDVLPESGLARALRRIAGLGEDDRARESWLVAASLATLPSSHRVAEPARVEAPARVDDATLRAATRTIVDRLAARAILGVDDASWLGLASYGDAGARLQPLDHGLYDGLPGVALALAYVGAATSDARATALARRAVAGLCRGLARDGSPAELGAFTGKGGLVYAFAHLAALWQDQRLLAHAHAIVAEITEAAPGDTVFDVVGGCAGAILGLGALWSIDPRENVAAAALACGERLLTAARVHGDALVWPSSTPTALPLTGFSHGAAGIAAALAELHAITEDPRWRDAAFRALAHERGCFDANAGNWPDLRFADRDDAFQTAWCHGAPGIGLARLRSLPVLDDAATRAELRAAIATTLAHGFTGSHCLCHGGFGNLELLVRAHEVGLLDDAAVLERAAAGLVCELERLGPRCATRTGVDTPGLMTGLAGIALALVRLLDPQSVPSLLALDRPRPMAP